MTSPARFHEATTQPRLRSIPLGHLSIELGHLYFEDFDAGPDFLRAHFQRIAPWVAAARATVAATTAKPPRISTCFLVDDYFGANRSPAELVPELIDAARTAGLDIDYLARESGCADDGRLSPAQLVEERIVADPPPGTNGIRPPVRETGWLSNGQRSPGSRALVAMSVAPDWAPPVQNAARRHSVFVDVELWSDQDGRRTWSCAFLASVWQLLRLGLVRSHGAPVAAPQPAPAELPERWDQLPAVIQLRPRAAPFNAYRTMSVLGNRFFATEHAVRTIVSQVYVETAVAEQIRQRAAAEGVGLPVEVVDRMEYVLTGGLPDGGLADGG